MDTPNQSKNIAIVGGGITGMYCAYILLQKGHLPRIHVCGEAYSDYHGFMEGSLRSGVYTLHRVLDCHESVDAELGDWLAECSPKNAAELKKWVKNVDSCRNQSDFQYK